MSCVGRKDKINLCSGSSCHVLCKAGKFFAKAGKFLTKAEKFSAKFDVFRLKRFKLKSELDVNASLQVTTGSMHDSAALVRDCRIVITPC